jgi:hypothetical protein
VDLEVLVITRQWIEVDVTTFIVDRVDPDVGVLKCRELGINLHVA